MKIRRITLAVLLLLTVLLIAEVRYLGVDHSSTREPSIYFNVAPRSSQWAVEKRQTFIQSQDGFTSLVIKGQQGTIDLRSTDSDEIRVDATIGADNEGVLDTFDVEERISNSELSYELRGGRTESLQEAGVSFVVEVPAGMEVSIDQQFGEVKIESFVGFLNLTTSFSNVRVRDLQGTASITNSFGNIDLRRIAGPLQLENSYSTSRVDLLAIDGGYDFDIEVINGTLVGRAPFKVETEQSNRLVAQGQSGDGVHSIGIRSRFGTVNLNLDD